MNHSRDDDIAASSVVARTPKRPARTEITLNHQFCARPGAFTSMGSRLNLYCGVEEGEEGGYRSALGLGGGDETAYRRPRCIRGAARVAPGVPARDTPARSKERTFAPSWLFLGWIRSKSGRRGTHGQLVAVLRPPPVRLRGLIPVLLPVRTEGKGRTSEPVRERARDGSRGRRRGNPRRGAIRWKSIRGNRGWARPVTHISSHFATVVVMCFSKSA